MQDLFTAQLQDLKEFFPDRRVLTILDVRNYTGRSFSWCKQHLVSDGKTGITVINLAHRLVNMGGEVQS